ncbi:hypothetical protein DFP72DRAFT_94017 [Ephemerocybe angulata]|uniref:Uncharacterized protein n=1 Tax=Ephemerocybe angulata TaxID=980116 RepID=A0A8H6I6X5_9AGAR|nr:hypothetical protein DFP72DRAFT_94017 [Tulosesus angulatus]
MALKRKLDVDTDDSAPMNQKQLKLVPFPNYTEDEDVAMSDAEPLAHTQFHLRLPSNASSASSSASDSPLTNSPPYPTFDLYPLPFFNESGMVDPNSHAFSHYSNNQPPSPQVGLIQPVSSNFVHHGCVALPQSRDRRKLTFLTRTNCTQIPKLRMACASGVNGQRTMWSHCEQCGAISMVDCD